MPLMASAEFEGCRRLGVMGGSFDPIHYAHLLVAEQVREHLHLSHVVFVPAASPPHKVDRTLAPAEDRYLMTVLATADHPHFSVSRVELDRPGPSYTLHTVRALKALLPDGAEVFLIVGADMVLALDSWHQPDALLDEAQVAAVPRPGFALQQLFQRLGPERAARITIVPVPALDISATVIRERLAAGGSARYLCPPPVLDYIAKRGLYRAEGAQLQVKL